MKEVICPHCVNHDKSMLEQIAIIELPKLGERVRVYLCDVCSKTFEVKEKIDAT